MWEIQENNLKWRLSLRILHFCHKKRGCNYSAETALVIWQSPGWERGIHTVKEGRRSSERWQSTGEQRDVRSFLLPNFRARITVFSLKRLQRYLFWRVVRHIKSSKEDNFTESWKHSAHDSINNVDVSSSNTSSLNTLHEFPQAANWCSIHRAEFPPITIEDMMNYFVKTIRI